MRVKLVVMAVLHGVFKAALYLMLSMVAIGMIGSLDIACGRIVVFGMGSISAVFIIVLMLLLGQSIAIAAEAQKQVGIVAVHTLSAALLMLSVVGDLEVAWSLVLMVMFVTGLYWLIIDLVALLLHLRSAWK